MTQEAVIFFCMLQSQQVFAETEKNPQSLLPVSTDMNVGHSEHKEQHDYPGDIHFQKCYRYIFKKSPILIVHFSNRC
jgi:hypothetical protein